MNDDLHLLAAAYALGALDDAERAAFEAHLPGCDTCRREVAEFSETSGRLAEATATAPPPGLRDAVLGEISRTRQVSPIGEASVASLDAHRRRRFGSPAWLASAAAVVALVVAAAVFMTARGGSTSVDDVLAAPDAVATTLQPTPDGGVGSFQIVWSAEQDRVAVIANGLPEPGPDRVYELWAIVDGTPVPAGLFDPDDGTVRGTTRLDDVDAAAWGVTIEPAGGSDAPTTPILFFAEA